MPENKFAELNEINETILNMPKSEKEGFMSEADIEDLSKATEDATPEEVTKMHESIDKAEEDVGSEDFEPEIRDIGLDTDYRDLMNGTDDGMPETDADIFQVADGFMQPSEEAVEARMKDNMEMFNLSEEDTVLFLAVISKYKKNKDMHLYNELPEGVKKMIKDLADSEGIPFSIITYNQIAKFFVDEFISSAEMDEAYVDFEKSLNEALKMPTIADLYSEHTKTVMDEKIPEMIEKIKDEYPEKAALLQTIRDKFYQATTLEKMAEHYKTNTRTRKLIRRDWEKPTRFCDEFNMVNARSKFKMPDCRSIIPALNRVLLDEFEPDSRVDQMKITEKDVNKFIVLFGRHCDGLNPLDVVDAAYMYYALKNITMLNLTNETKTSFAAELINKICDIIELIRAEEEEFNAANNNVKKGKRTQNKR